MKRVFKILSILTFATLLIMICCEKDKADNWNILKELYQQYKDGEIDECTYNDETVYIAGINAYDAGATVYDYNGDIIGSCNYAWGGVDSICGQLNDCKVIYRCDNHITGEPPVDKYGLGK